MDFRSTGTRGSQNWHSKFLGAEMTMGRMIKLVLASLLLVSPVLAQDNGAAALAAAGCGPRATEFNVKKQGKQHPIPQAGSGEATVAVISQLGVCVGCRNILRIGIDSDWVGANDGHAYSFSSVQPGDHHVCVAWQSKLKGRSETSAALTVAAKPGNVYYFLATLAYGGRLVLRPVDSAEGPLMIKSASFDTSEPKKPAGNS